MDRVEMERSRTQGFCCGGGGGQMWMETDPNTRINHRRLSQAVDESGADVVVTACPYCLIMFDDAVRSKGLGDQVQVLDLAEVLANPPREDAGGEAG
jgi:Fe-S oxidoreductase